MDPNDSHHPQPHRSSDLQPHTEVGTERGPVAPSYVATDNDGAAIPQPADIGQLGTGEERGQVLAAVLAGLIDPGARNAS